MRVARVEVPPGHVPDAERRLVVAPVRVRVLPRSLEGHRQRGGGAGGAPGQGADAEGRVAGGGLLLQGVELAGGVLLLVLDEGVAGIIENTCCCSWKVKSNFPFFSKDLISRWRCCEISLPVECPAPERRLQLPLQHGCRSRQELRHRGAAGKNNLCFF